MTRLSRFAAALLLPLAGAPALADWQLAAEDAGVHFISIKAEKIAEVHSFGQVTGSADASGKVRIAIDLASVDTSIEIRNQRMREMLFEVADFPTAVITADLDGATLSGIGAGQSLALSAPGRLSLHGREQELRFELQVTGTDDGGLLVSSRSPVVVNAADFALARGVEALREVAGLPSISPAVPVTFTLHFRSR